MVGKLKKAEKSQNGAVDELAAYVRKAIAEGSFAPGAKLPSVRKLAELRKVSPNSVNAALGILEAERLIVRHPQKGVFVRSVAFDPAKPVALVCFLLNRVPEENWNVHVGLGAAAALSERGIPFSIVEPDRNAATSFEALAAFVKTRVPSPGGVLFTWAACGEEELAKLSKELEAPVVKIGRRERSCKSNFASIDHFEAGRLAASKALGRMKGECLVISGASMHDFPRRQLVDGFIDRLQEERPASLGVKMRFIAGGQFEDGRAAMLSHLEACAAPPSCVYCVGDHMALGAMRAAIEAGFKVPEEISFIGSNGFESAKLATPSMAHLSQPMEELGAKAVEILVEAKGVEGFLTPGAFVDVRWQPGGSLA